MIAFRPLYNGVVSGTHLVCVLEGITIENLSILFQDQLSRIIVKSTCVPTLSA